MLPDRHLARTAGALATILAWSLAACADDPTTESAPAFTVRDSAGVTIAESTDSAWTESTRWRIADEPDLSIGSVDGSVPGTDFGSAPVPVSMPNGIAVRNGQTDDIRVFDADGRWVRTVGGLGDGPVEFRFLYDAAVVAGDSVAGWDYNMRKIVTFPTHDDGDARYHATPSRTHAGRFEWAMSGWFPDGRYLLGARDDPRDQGPGSHLNMEWLVLYSPAGDSLDAFGPFPAYWTEAGPEGQVYMRLMSRQAITRLGREAIWRGVPQAGFEVRRFDLATGSRRIVRRSSQRMSPPEGIRQAGLRQELEGYPGASETVRAAMRRMWESTPMVDSLPAFYDFLTTPDGYLWMRQVAHPDDVPVDDQPYLSAYATGLWTVLAPEGRWLGTVAMPDDFVMHEAGEGWILGVRTDDLGVAWIERYPIIRP